MNFDYLLDRYIRDVVFTANKLDKVTAGSFIFSIVYYLLEYA